MNYVAQAREVIDVEIEGLRCVRDALDSGFSQAVEAILAALADGGKIVVTGIGKNLHIAEKMSATLASTGSTSVVLNPSQAMHGDLGIICRRDVLLALSYSGESEELLALLPLVKRAGTCIVAMTGVPDSRLAGLSDIVLPVTVEREACPFNMAPTCSTTAALAVGDALAMVLLEARGFKKEDYARLHPGGSIGRSLLLRVADIMRTGDRLARVPREATVRETVVEMTRARAGSAGIVDEEGCLLGIFTDGDLRRHMMAGPHLIDSAVADSMTRTPITVTPDMLAADVLRIFEDHSIDDLAVVDDGNRLVGAIDIQDLPKVKIL